MVIDGRTLPRGQVVETDVCIIGAGAAGITLARELRGQTTRVCLVESGGFEFDPPTQALYKGAGTGLPYYDLDMARLRYFGGSTNHWSGWCCPLDEIDFEARSWIPMSGWPFGRQEIVPYYRRAQGLCQLGPFVYDAEQWEGPQTPRLPFAAGTIHSKVIQFSPPTFFGQLYREDIARAPNITTLLFSNVVGIRLAKNGRSVQELAVACLDGNRFSLKARVYILATGGIENARLLLASNDVRTNGVGNDHDLVGRYFGEHPMLTSGALVLSDPDRSLGLYSRHRPPREPRGENASGDVRAWLTIDPALQRQEQIVNLSVLLRPAEWANHFVKPPVKAAMRLDFEKLAWSLREAIKGFDVLAQLASGLTREAVGAAESNLTLYEFTSVLEQSPNPDSRVRLSQEKDELGMNRAQLDWRINEIDKRSIRRAQELIGLEMARQGLGRVLMMIDEDDKTWPPELFGGYHHMGTTRMHREARHGVVDPNCQVHGIGNLYIAGSSVFPTVGYANPTLTIVALSLRLADHIKRIIA